MGPDAMIFVFWIFSCKSTFSLFSFTFIKRFFSPSSLFAISVISSTYLRLLILLPAVLIPACASGFRGFIFFFSVQGAHLWNEVTLFLCSLWVWMLPVTTSEDSFHHPLCIHTYTYIRSQIPGILGLFQLLPGQYLQILVCSCTKLTYIRAWRVKEAIGAEMILRNSTWSVKRKNNLHIDETAKVRDARS